MTATIQPGSALAEQLDRDRDAFAASLRAADAVAAAARYTDDATVVAPAGEVHRGREAIEGFWRTGFEIGIHDVELDVLDIELRSDVVFEVGEYALHIAPETGPRIVNRGRYLVVHRIGPEGSWRRAAEMFSPDLVAEGATPPRA